MKKIFHTWGVHKRVCFAGVLKGKALVSAYHAMDVFAFASKSETQGMVITEAMAAGLPVVALDATGVREVVQDQVNGRLLAAESRKTFASALAWCSSRSTVQWNQIKKAAIETAHNFSMKICADKALEVYDEVRFNDTRRTEDQWDSWQVFLGRFKTEWEMLLNLGKAAGSAVVKTAVGESSPKEKIAKLYQQKMTDARHSWMLALKKIRRQIKDASGETKVEFEKTAESMVQKIRAYETELAELNRKVLSSCETLEKFLEDAHSQMKNEFENTKEDSMKQKLGIMAMVILLAATLISCHSETSEGFGRDVQKLGQKIENH